VTLSILKQAVLAVGLLGLADAARGQIPRSQLGIVTQSVGTARVEITRGAPHWLAGTLVEVVDGPRPTRTRIPVTAG